MTGCNFTSIWSSKVTWDLELNQLNMRFMQVFFKFPVEHVVRVDVADDGQLLPDGAVDAGRQSTHVAAHDAEQLGDVA